MSAEQNPVNMMERVQMASTNTLVLAKMDTLGLIVKQVSFKGKQMGRFVRVSLGMNPYKPTLDFAFFI